MLQKYDVETRAVGPPSECEVREWSNGLAAQWWGPSWWTVLYSLADGSGARAFAGVTRLARVLPCKPCRESFAQQLQSYPRGDGSVSTWLSRAHAHASRREVHQGSQRATRQTVALVARCIAANYPLNATDERCAYSWQALHFLVTVFPHAFPNPSASGRFACGETLPVPSVSRASLAKMVDELLDDSMGSEELEQFRFYSSVQARRSRYERALALRLGSGQAAAATSK